jgi:hypothetical protein
MRGGQGAVPEPSVIPPKKAMHGWTSQPWHPTVVFMVEGARRDMNIPAQAGIQFFFPGMTGYHEHPTHMKYIQPLGSPSTRSPMILC